FDDAGNHVVNHGALGGTELYRLDPDIFLEGQVDDGVAVFDGAGGRHQEVLRIHHQVGFAQFPALGEAKAGQRLFGTVTPGCTGIDPVHQCLDIGVTDVAGIGEVVDVRVNLRRRHTLGHQRFADHGRPALDHLVAVHGKWADTAFAVARGTLFLEDRGYVGGVVGRSGRVHGAGRELHGTAAGLHGNSLGSTRAVGNGGLDGCANVIGTILCTRRRLVDRTAVKDFHALRIHYHHFASLGDAQGFGHQLGAVDQH